MEGDLLALFLLLAFAGVLAGLLAGLLGVGGGLIIVPVVLEVLTWSGVNTASAMLVATGTSLAAIVPTAISSTYAHQRRGNVDRAVLSLWAAPMAIAVLFGAWLAPRLPVEPLLGLFTVFALTVALKRLLWSSAPVLRDQLPAPMVQMGLAAGIGFICVLLGIGAGTLGVAVLTAFAMPVHRAVGTAAALGLVIAIPGAIVAALNPVPADAPSFTLGQVSLPALLAIVPLAIVCAPLGVRIGARLAPEQLQKVFAVFLLGVGLRMLSRLF